MTMTEHRSTSTVMGYSQTKLMLNGRAIILLERTDECSL